MAPKGVISKCYGRCDTVAVATLGFPRGAPGLLPLAWKGPEPESWVGSLRIGQIAGLALNLLGGRKKKGGVHRSAFRGVLGALQCIERLLGCPVTTG